MRKATEDELKKFYTFVPWTLGRVQIIRKKGHHIPDDALNITRRTRFLGNPFPMTDPKDPECHKIVVERFRKWIAEPAQARRVTQFLALVRYGGFNSVACYCKLDEVCHGDVWIDIWNNQGV